MTAMRNWSELNQILTGGRWDAVAWDFDGVLYNSNDLFRQVLVGECNALGLTRAASLAATGALPGRDTPDIVDALVRGAGEGDTNALLKRVEGSFAREAFERLSINQAGLDLVRLLDGLGVRQCIVSNNSHALVHSEVVRSGVDEVLWPVLTPSAIHRPKPAPDLYHAARDVMTVGAARRGVVAIEDSDLGEEAAIAAGLEVIRVQLY